MLWFVRNKGSFNRLTISNNTLNYTLHIGKYKFFRAQHFFDNKHHLPSYIMEGLRLYRPESYFQRLGR